MYELVVSLLWRNYKWLGKDFWREVYKMLQPPPPHLITRILPLQKLHADDIYFINETFVSTPWIYGQYDMYSTDKEKMKKRISYLNNLLFDRDSYMSGENVRQIRSYHYYHGCLDGFDKTILDKSIHGELLKLIRFHRIMMERQKEVKTTPKKDTLQSLRNRQLAVMKLNGNAEFGLPPHTLFHGPANDLQLFPFLK